MKREITPRPLYSVEEFDKGMNCWRLAYAGASTYPLFDTKAAARDWITDQRQYAYAENVFMKDSGLPLFSTKFRIVVIATRAIAVYKELDAET